MCEYACKGVIEQIIIGIPKDVGESFVFPVGFWKGPIHYSKFLTKCNDSQKLVNNRLRIEEEDDDETRG